MAKDINIVTISGRLGADPELRYTPSGTSVVNFRIASSRPYKQGEEWTEETAWVGVTAWQNLAERVNDAFGKGDRVIVTGRLREETWTDKNGGGKRSKLTITADNVQPMGDWRDFGGKVADDEDEAPAASTTDDDDLPF